MKKKTQTEQKSNGVLETKAMETEVLPKKQKRRRLTVDYKLRILEEIDACTEPGQVGALLRREKLYSSQLAKWRRLRKEGRLHTFSEPKRGPKPTASPEVREELKRLRKENMKLQNRLAKAETIIEVQKKVCTLLGVTPYEEESGRKP